MTRLFERLNPVRTRRFLWALSAIQVALAIAIVNWTLAERAYGPTVLPPPPETEPPIRVERPRDDSAIWKTRLGEARSRSAPPPRPPEPGPRPVPIRRAPDLESRFLLKGLLSGTRGSCILLDLQSKKECILFVGNELPDGLGRLESVHADRVAFRAGVEEKVLRLPAPRSLALGSAAAESSCAREEFVDPSGWRQGALGLVVVRPPASARQIEAGDRLLAINGKSVDTIDDVGRLALPGAVRLTLVRAGATLEVVVRIDG